LPEVSAAFTFPLDLQGAMRRAVARVRPRCFIALETEIWPNLLHTLAGAGIPAILANGRISDRSFGRYGRVRPLFRRVLAEVTLFLMQSDEDARRIVSLGAPPERVAVTGNLKMEPPPATGVGSRDWARLLGLGPADRVLIAGSTHPGEEGPVLDAFAALSARLPLLRLVIAPRHPERAGEVEALAQARGLEAVRRSQLNQRPAGRVVLLDTVGELAELYRVGDVIFVGGSLVPIGGHNVIEPAREGKAIVFGPHMTNFRDAAALLLAAGGAIQLAGSAALAPAARELLEDAAARTRIGEAARRAVQAHQGACQRTVDAIERVVESRSGSGGAP
jgi:3-deoxy-D-manno-octulosonic-acid transferase